MDICRQGRALPPSDGGHKPLIGQLELSGGRLLRCAPNMELITYDAQRSVGSNLEAVTSVMYCYTCIIELLCGPGINMKL
jgi:hypothetical protein